MPQTTETLPNGLSLLQDDRFFKLGQDSVLLSAFAKIRRRARVLDLGCGTGDMSTCTISDLPYSANRLVLQGSVCTVFLSIFPYLV